MIHSQDRLRFQSGKKLPQEQTYENHDLIDKHELIQLREYDAIEVIVIDEDSKGRKRFISKSKQRLEKEFEIVFSNLIRLIIKYH